VTEDVAVLGEVFGGVGYGMVPNTFNLLSGIKRIKICGLLFSLLV